LAYSSEITRNSCGVVKLGLLVKKHMATLKQTEANRRNALKSTGPKTPEGKAIVSMNSLRHGLRARTVVLPGESREEFNQLCDTLQAEWKPRSRTAQFYLEQMAVSQWKLTRMEVAESNVYQETLTAKIQIPLLDRLWQAQCRLERSYARAQRELERLDHRRPHWTYEPDEDEEEEAEEDEEVDDPAPELAEEAPAAAAPVAAAPGPGHNASHVVPTVIPTVVAPAAAPVDPAQRPAALPRAESARRAAS